MDGFVRDLVLSRLALLQKQEPRAANTALANPGLLLSQEHDGVQNG